MGRRPAAPASGDPLTPGDPSPAEDFGQVVREHIERGRRAQQAMNELGVGSAPAEPVEAPAPAPPSGLALHVPLALDADLAVVEGVAFLRKAMRDLGAGVHPVEDVRGELVTAIVVEFPGRDPLLFTVTRP